MLEQNLSRGEVILWRSLLKQRGVSFTQMLQKWKSVGTILKVCGSVPLLLLFHQMISFIFFTSVLKLKQVVKCERNRVEILQLKNITI